MSTVADDAVPAFEPISRETLSGRIREELLGRITSGELSPGARIPSERDLSEQFRVARTSVREAIQGLVSLAVIERRGNRNFVVEQLPDITLERTPEDDRKAFVRQLFETRRTLEVTITELAAQRADDAERAEIAEIAAQFGPRLTIDSFRRLDRRFHAAIAKACGNPLLVEVYSKVQARLFESDDLDQLLSAKRNRAEVARIVDEATRAHRAISSAIADGDSEAAVAHSRAHLDRVESRLIDRLV